MAGTPARDALLEGCGLPGAWAGETQWRILETGFGAGLNFLAAWRAWKEHSQRPRLLHYVAIDASPVGAQALRLEAQHDPGLAPLAEALAAQWSGLLPGAHRLSFESGRVLLTLHVGDVKRVLRGQPFTADSVFLDETGSADDAAAWDDETLKALSRHCRRGARLATRTSVPLLRQGLERCGFKMDESGLQATFDPAWEPKRNSPRRAATPGTCIVVGAGLAGAAVSASLARRGWRVTLLDAADAPAAGASALPAGLLAPHHSADDNLLSRLARSGIRLTLQQARELLVAGTDWQLHGELAWIKPAALVRAWIRSCGIEWLGNAVVARLVRDGDAWTLLDAGGQPLARAPLVIVAAAYASHALLDERLALQPVRGQVSWAMTQPQLDLPPAPVRGNGHFIPGVPAGNGTAWYCGSTYERGDTDTSIRAADHRANFGRLQELLPDVAAQLAPAFESGDVYGWAGVRCASQNRRPLLGELEPGLWVSTAMGSRGLTFSALCAELLAARLHDEPLPLDHRLAGALKLPAGA